eukprot:357425-Chlamydomonas_euryale.AAC.9
MHRIACAQGTGAFPPSLHSATAPTRALKFVRADKEYFADTFVSGKLWSAATGTKPYGGPIIWNENRPVVRFTKLELDYDIGISEGGYRLVFTSLAGWVRWGQVAGMWAGRVGPVGTSCRHVGWQGGSGGDKLQACETGWVGPVGTSCRHAGLAGWVRWGQAAGMQDWQGACSGDELKACGAHRQAGDVSQSKGEGYGRLSPRVAAAHDGCPASFLMSAHRTAGMHKCRGEGQGGMAIPPQRIKGKGGWRFHRRESRGKNHWEACSLTECDRSLRACSSMAEICPDNCTYATVTTESICTLGQLGSTPIIVVEGPDFVQPYGPPPVVAPVDDPPPVVAPAPGHQAGDGPGTAVPEVSAMEAAKAKAKALVEAGAKLGEIMDAVTRILYDAKAAGADFTMDDMRSIIAYINTLRA